MKNHILQLDKIALDYELLKKLILQNQQEYIRKKLRFIQYLYETKNVLTSSKKLGINSSTGHRYLNLYLESGLEILTKKKTKTTSQRLSIQDKQKLREILLTKTPQDYGFDRYIWTGQILEQLIKQEFNVELKDSRIYEILAELRLSHQKAHRDYDNSDPEKQLEFQENLKKNFKLNKNWRQKDKR